MSSEGVSVSEWNEGSRKRKRSIARRQKSKLLRYQDHFPNIENFERPCAHNGPTYNCVKISEQDIIALRSRVLHTPDKNANYPIFAKVQAPKRRRENYKPNCILEKNVLSAEYSMHTVNGSTYRVIQKMLFKSFGISLKRLHTITNNMVCGKDIIENRGGDRRSVKNLTNRNNVIQFIGKLKAKESYYNGMKSRRLYLPANLNITRFWKIYSSSTTENFKVKLEALLQVFVASVSERKRNLHIPRVLGQDWFIEDYKALDKDLKKLVVIKDMKRIIFRKDNKGLVKIKMEPNYRNEDTSKKFEAVTKKRQKTDSSTVE
nr:unnamed protein product [Callosobruchus analis]